MIDIHCGACKNKTQADFISGWVYKCKECSALNNIHEDFIEEQQILPGAEPLLNDEPVMMNPDDLLNDLTVKEWSNQDYDAYTPYILARINTDSFDNIRALNAAELKAGYLNEEQLTAFKKILKSGIVNDWSIRNMIKKVIKDVNPGDLIVTVEPTDDRDGYERTIPEDYRTQLMVRGETTRVVNNGSLDYYKDLDITKVRFIAINDSTTCEECSNMNGELYDIDESSNMVPIHVGCRCFFTGEPGEQ